MVHGATRRRTPRPRTRWAVALLAVAALATTVALIELARLLTAPDAVETIRHVGHPNTRALVLPILPRP